MIVFQKCQNIVKYVHLSYSEIKLTSSQIFICQTNSSKPQNILFTVADRCRKPNLFTFGTIGEAVASDFFLTFLI